ncbi:unnamed protein product, partial [Mesorhabditis belari]|uniref:Uncharacterized protein n=1 Tax=Mesorhabditis belari TaxID=2138241 RepID=A0AAF3EI22_9BILA
MARRVQNRPSPPRQAVPQARRRLLTEKGRTHEVFVLPESLLAGVATRGRRPARARGDRREHVGDRSDLGRAGSSPELHHVHDREATTARILQLARLSIVLTFLSLLCEQSNVWLKHRRLFFVSLHMQFSSTNIRRVLLQVKKITLSDQIEQLRRMKQKQKRWYIPSPFSVKLSYDKLIHQLKRPITEYLVGWSWVCEVAKRLSEPLRLAMVVPRAQGRDVTEDCTQIVEAFVNDQEMWARNNLWFMEDGKELLVVLKTQLKLKERNLVKGWSEDFVEQDGDKSEDEELTEEVDHQGEVEEPEEMKRGDHVSNDEHVSDASETY